MANLRNSLAELAASANRLTSEATLRQYFVQALDDFVRAEGLFSIDAGPLFRLEEPVIRGRADAKLGGLTFEVKLPKPRGEGIDAAVVQVQRYIDEYRAAGVKTRGVAYDGKNICLLSEDKEIVYQGDVLEGATTFAAWLTLLAPAARTPEDMVQRFGSQSALSQQTIRALFELLNEFEARIPFIEEVFTIWQALYGCAANINKDTVQTLKRTARDLDIRIRSKKDAERFVFVTETYLSIFLKLIVARVAVEQKLISHVSVHSLLCEPPGREHLRYTELVSLIPHLSNVFEDDPFEWFIDAAREDRPAENTVKNVIRCIG